MVSLRNFCFKNVRPPQTTFPEAPNDIENLDKIEEKKSLILQGCQISKIRQYEQQLLQDNLKKQQEVIETLEKDISYSPVKEKNCILYENLLPPIHEAVAIHEETIDAKLETSKEEVKGTKILEEENNTEITNLKDKKEDDTKKMEAKLTFIDAEIDENDKVKKEPLLDIGVTPARSEEGCHFCQSCSIY